MCVTPFLLNRDGVITPVSCGRCFECVRKRKLDWQIRITSEANSSDVCFFSLLSYSPEHYPDPDLPDKRAIQLLVKSLRSRINRMSNDIMPRKDVSRPIDLKYFIVSEYGEERNRLHYHCIFFLRNVYHVTCNRVFWKEFLENTWSKGFASAFDLQRQNISYVCKYIQKEYNMLLSSRLGKEGASKSIVYDGSLDMFPSFPINGRLHPVPKTWSKELIGDQKHNLIGLNLANKFHINKLSYNDRIMLNQGFLKENPRYKIDSISHNVKNLDILPNGEF